MRLLLFSGMAGDSRLYRYVRVAAPGVEVVTPDHVEPRKGETLESYAERVAEHHGIGAGDVIGGASFGGMLVSQIAAARKVRGLALLGTTLRPRTLPFSYAALSAAGPLIPDALLALRSWFPLLELRFAPLTDDARATLREMAFAFPPSYIRRFGEMVFRWKGASRTSCPSFAVHGKLDRMIPIRCADPDLVLEGAGHCFTLTHPAETSAALARFVSSLS